MSQMEDHINLSNISSDENIDVIRHSSNVNLADLANVNPDSNISSPINSSLLYRENENFIENHGRSDYSNSNASPFIDRTRNSFPDESTGLLDVSTNGIIRRYSDTNLYDIYPSKPNLILFCLAISFFHFIS